jgi:hypothetical protein
MQKEDEVIVTNMLIFIIHLGITGIVELTVI